MMEPAMSEDHELIMLSYTSIASHLMAHDELIQLLHQARENNHNRGITGMLLYMEGCFFQVLEGDRAVLEALYVKIGQDKRHHHVIKLLEESITTRGFDAWSMGYRHVTREDLVHETGLTDFLDKEESGFDGMHSEHARALISAFRQGRWQTQNTRQYRYVSLA
jgi:Sensors of blue-light using FAD